MKTTLSALRAWRQRSKPLLRQAGLRSVSQKRQRENRARTEVLRTIKGGPCQIRWDDGCTGIAVDGDEIKSAARGGSRTDPANIRGACRHCHTLLTDHPGEAERRGLTRHSWEKNCSGDMADVQW